MQEQTFKLGAYFDEFRLIKSHFWIVTENQFTIISYRKAMPT